MSSSSVPPPPPITTDTDEITYAVNSSPPKRRDSSPKALHPRKLSMSSITEYAITPSISSSSTITVNLPTPEPTPAPPPPPPPVAPVYKITPVSTSSSGFEPIATVTATPTELMPSIAPITLNPSFLPKPIDLPKKINLNFPSLALAHSALTAAAAVNKPPVELSPASSPEIIVDEVEKSPPKSESESSDQHNVTPSKEAKIVSRGPKKNFLARQAALDAKLNVLRIRAEKTTSDESKVSLEMSDDEVIQHQ